MASSAEELEQLQREVAEKEKGIVEETDKVESDREAIEREKEELRVKFEGEIAHLHESLTRENKAFELRKTELETQILALAEKERKNFASLQALQVEVKQKEVSHSQSEAVLTARVGELESENANLSSHVESQTHKF